jgi:hypothetical protein
MIDETEAALAHLEERILLAAARGHESSEKFYVSTRDRVTNILVENGVLGFVGRNRMEERLAVDRLCERGLLRPEGRWRYAPTEEGLRKARGASEASDGRPAGPS